MSKNLSIFIWLHRAFLSAAVLASSGCGGRHAAEHLTAACRSLGICEQPEPAAEAIEVLCDGSAGSTCCSQSISATLNLVLRYAAERPGSTVRLWALGEDFGATAIVGSVTSSHPAKSGSRAAKTHRERFVESSRAYLMKSVEAYLGKPTNKRSPLVECVAKLAMAQQGSLQRLFILVGDAREMSPSFGDWECGPLPDVKTFIASAHKRKVLGPDSLRGVRIHFSFVSVGQVDQKRCAASVERARQIEDLWRSLLLASGAREVRFSMGLPDLDQAELGR